MGKRTRKNRVAPPTPRNTRADARRLFPHQSREFQARWVLAKLRLRNRRWHAPIGTEHVNTAAPDFLRVLPRHDTAHLEITPTATDRVNHGLRVVREFFHVG